MMNGILDRVKSIPISSEYGARACLYRRRIILHFAVRRLTGCELFAVRTANDEAQLK